MAHLAKTDIRRFAKFDNMGLDVYLQVLGKDTMLATERSKVRLEIRRRREKLLAGLVAEKGPT